MAQRLSFDERARVEAMSAEGVGVAVCSASEFVAEMVPRIELTLAGSGANVRGFVSERERNSSVAAPRPSCQAGAGRYSVTG